MNGGKQERPSEPKIKSPPSADQLLSLLRAKPEEAAQSQNEISDEYQQSAVNAEAEWVKLSAIKDHYKQKKYWSWFLMFLLAGLLIFQSLLLGLVGAGIWNFEKYDWLLPALLAQNLGQIVALAYVVVKSLFR